MTVSPSTDPAATLAIVVTTINDGAFVTQLLPLLAAGEGRVRLIVVGDENTPPECASALRRAASEGHDIVWMDVPSQNEWLAQTPGLGEHIPWRSDNRRNLGILEAYRLGVDVVVLLDDDNIPVDPVDFIGRYRSVGGTAEAFELETDGPWLNPCELLVCTSAYGAPSTPVHIFPRGHPVSRRGPERARRSASSLRATAPLHLGLWVGEPDVDAATRAALAPVVHHATDEAPLFAPAGGLLAMSSQNLAAARRVVPAWWYVRMGEIVPNVRMDRFGDILQGCFAARAVAALGERILVGSPLVEHRRNPHALLRDMAFELPGMALQEALLDMLEAPVKPARSYAEAYLRIADDLTDHARTARPLLWGDAFSRWADATAGTMAAWVEACRTLAPDEADKPAR